MSLKQAFSKILTGCLLIICANSYADTWQLKIEGLYADQSNNLPILYGFAPLHPYTKSSNPYTVFGENIFPDPEESWGFGAQLGYIFSSQLYDIQLSYFGMNSDAHSQGTMQNLDVPEGPHFGYDTDEEFNLNTADLMFGHFFNPTEDLMLHGSFGITFADIDQKNHTFLDDIGSPGNANVHVKNSFVGAGPKAQLDGSFEFLEYLGVVGNIGLGALLGEAEVQNDIVQNGGDPFTDEFEDSDKRVAIEVDTKLGLLYNRSINDDTSINLEAGYKFVTYLNAFQDEPIQQLVTNDALLFQADSDYFYSGPYVILGVDFM